MPHHAYYIDGSQAQFEELKAELKPFWARQYERFGIDEARELISFGQLKNFGEAIYLIGAASITSEAQQALLKLFEEPQRGSTYVLLLPHGTLLPTLRSRMLAWPTQQILEKKSSGHLLASDTTRLFSREFAVAETDAAAFLKASNKDRSAEITAILKDEDGVKERVRDFLNALEAALAEHMTDPNMRAGLEDIAKMRSYVADRSPALKMLLEHLALSLPQV